MRERQHRAYELVRKGDFLIKAKHQAANNKLNLIFRQRPNFAAGQWVWIYDDKSTISGGGKHVLKAPTDESSLKSFALVSKNIILDRAVQGVTRGPWQGARR